MPDKPKINYELLEQMVKDGRPTEQIMEKLGIKVPFYYEDMISICSLLGAIYKKVQKDPNESMQVFLTTVADIMPLFLVGSSRKGGVEAFGAAYMLFMEAQKLAFDRLMMKEFGCIARCVSEEELNALKRAGWTERKPNEI